MSRGIVEVFTRYRSTNKKRGLVKDLVVTNPSLAYKKKKKKRRRGKKSSTTEIHPADYRCVIDRPRELIVTYADWRGLAKQLATFKSIDFCAVVWHSDPTLTVYTQAVQQAEQAERAIVPTFREPPPTVEEIFQSPEAEKLRDLIKGKLRKRKMEQEEEEEAEEEMERPRQFMRTTPPAGEEETQSPLATQIPEEYLASLDAPPTVGPRTLNTYWAILWQKWLGKTRPFAGIHDKEILLIAPVMWNAQLSVFCTPNSGKEIVLNGSIGNFRRLERDSVIVFGILRTNADQTSNFIHVFGSFSVKNRINVVIH